MTEPDDQEPAAEPETGEGTSAEASPRGRGSRTSARTRGRNAAVAAETSSDAESGVEDSAEAHPATEAAGAEPEDRAGGEGMTGTGSDEPAVLTYGDDEEDDAGGERASFVLGLGPLKSAIESLIFVSNKPLTDRMLADLAHASVNEVRMAAYELGKDYEGRGIELFKIAGGYQFRSSARNANFVRKLVAPKPIRLSRALLETLTIVAYRQPVTRPEIDDIRGVDSGESLRVLLERDLVRILGRKEVPGLPHLFGTTKHFLEFFGLDSLRDLPTLREYAELTDDSRALFERRMGEPLDLKSVQAQADAAVAEAHAHMFDGDPDPDSPPPPEEPSDEPAPDTDRTTELLGDPSEAPLPEREASEDEE